PALSLSAGSDKCQLGDWNRAPEQIALDLTATGRAGERKLLLRLNAFSGCCDIETLSETNDRTHNGRAVGTLSQFADERPVNLDLVEREHRQIAQRGMPGGEVVKDDGNAGTFQSLQLRNVFSALLQQNRFGNFQFEALGGELRGAQRVRDNSEQIATLELSRGKIDRHLDIRRPAQRVSARLTDDPFAERCDKASFLCDWNELIGKDDPSLRVAPADQGLDDADLVGRDVENGLIVQFELRSFDSAAQLGLQLVARSRIGLHLAFEESIAI